MKQQLTLGHKLGDVNMDCLGGCHCGNVHVRLRLTKPPEDNLLRACTCSFCRSHNPRMLSDPEGSFEVRADNWSLVERYRLAAAPVISSSAVVRCVYHRCGGVERGRARVVNVNCLDDHRHLDKSSHYRFA